MNYRRHRSLVRRLSLLLLLTSLSGCTGLDVFVDHTFSNPAHNPNLLIADSETARRIRGLDSTIEPMEVEPGNVWPKFDTRDSTLGDVEEQSRRANVRGFAAATTSGAQPGSPDHQQPRPHHASSGPPPGAGHTPSLASVSSIVPPPSGASGPKLSGAADSASQGSAIDAGGTSFYRQFNTSSGPGAIIVPNGNGTSTVINSNGTIQTIPTQP